MQYGNVFEIITIFHLQNMVKKNYGPLGNVVNIMQLTNVSQLQVNLHILLSMDITLTVRQLKFDKNSGVESYKLSGVIPVPSVKVS